MNLFKFSITSFCISSSDCLTSLYDTLSDCCVLFFEAISKPRLTCSQLSSTCFFAFSISSLKDKDALLRLAFSGFCTTDGDISVSGSLSSVPVLSSCFLSSTEIINSSSSLPASTVSSSSPSSSSSLSIWKPENAFLKKPFIPPGSSLSSPSSSRLNSSSTSSCCILTSSCCFLNSSSLSSSLSFFLFLAFSRIFFWVFVRVTPYSCLSLIALSTYIPS